MCQPALFVILLVTCVAGQEQDLECPAYVKKCTDLLESSVNGTAEHFGFAGQRLVGNVWQRCGCNMALLVCEAQRRMEEYVTGLGMNETVMCIEETSSTRNMTMVGSWRARHWRQYWLRWRMMTWVGCRERGG